MSIFFRSAAIKESSVILSDSGRLQVAIKTVILYNLIESWKGPKEDIEGWQAFLQQLKQRGLTSVGLVISDKCLRPYQKEVAHHSCGIPCY